MPLHMRLPKLKGFNNRFGSTTRWSTWTGWRSCSPPAATVDARGLAAAARSARASW